MIGGAEVAVKEITDRLSGIEFDLICARIKKELPVHEKIGNVEVWRVGGGRGKSDKFLLPWRGFKLAKKLHREKRYDAIWAIMASFGGLAAARFKKHFPEIPYLLTLQEGDTPQHIRSRARWLGSGYDAMFRRADHLTAISEYLKEFARKHQAGAGIDLIPNGVDMKLFSVKDNEVEELTNLKKELKKGERDKFIVHTGRLTQKNGLEQIIRALPFLPEQFKFLVVGGGADLEKLKDLAQELRVGERVIFAGEFPHPQMVKYLKISDVFVRPSLSEGLGNSFLEAMALGVPVIGTRVGGIPDFLRNEETGLFCEIGDPQDLAQKIKKLFSDDDLRQRIVDNGKKLIAEKYDWDQIVKKMKNIFNKLSVKKYE